MDEPSREWDTPLTDLRAPVKSGPRRRGQRTLVAPRSDRVSGVLFLLLLEIIHGSIQATVTIQWGGLAVANIRRLSR